MRCSHWVIYNDWKLGVAPSIVTVIAGGRSCVISSSYCRCCQLHCIALLTVAALLASAMLDYLVFCAVNPVRFPMSQYCVYNSWQHQWQSCSVYKSWGPTPSRTGDRINICTYFVFETWISSSANFLIVFHTNYVSVLLSFWDMIIGQTTDDRQMTVTIAYVAFKVGQQ